MREEILADMPYRCHYEMEIKMEIGIAVLLGFLLDLLLGDPHWLPHPVRLIGWMIAKGETILRLSLIHI